MDLSDYSILLVEDDSNDILFFERAFRRVNQTQSIHIVKDGDAAVDYLSGDGIYTDRDRYPMPALILLDLKLPRRSGIEVLSWLRQQPVLRRIPVIVLTSSKESLDINRTYEIGISSYLVKPVSFAALNDLIASIERYWLQLNEYPSLLSE